MEEAAVAVHRTWETSEAVLQVAQSGKLGRLAALLCVTWVAEGPKHVEVNGAVCPMVGAATWPTEVRSLPDVVMTAVAGGLAGGVGAGDPVQGAGYTAEVSVSAASHNRSS